MNLWPWWLAAGIALGIAELFTGDLVFLMIALGSFVAALAAYLDAPVAAQALLGAGSSLALLVFVRPLALRTLRPLSETVTNTPRLVGQQGLVLEVVGEHDGRIKLDGEVWSARTDGAAETLDPGTAVVVVRIEGATAVVARKED
jgi:membrane protein implicated in regulation of membrane protease activity